MIDIADIVSRVSLGNLCPSMKISMVDSISVQNVDGTVVPSVRPAICIVITVADAFNDDVTAMPLFQCCPTPEVPFATEQEAVAWIYGRIRAVLLHELDEFFSFDGKVFRAPVHPIPDE